jgi:hypothetical protein
MADTTPRTTKCGGPDGLRSNFACAQVSEYDGFVVS